MPNYRRPRVDGATLFFTVALADRRSRLLVERVDALREAVRLTQAERPFGIDAWVVLPDHLHAVWTLPADDADYSIRWSLIKSRFSRACPRGPRRASHAARGERGVWQRRFWEHHVRGETGRRKAIEYCWGNPVKHGLVTDARDWPYSSWHRDNGP